MGWFLLGLLAADGFDSEKIVVKTPQQIHLDSIKPSCKHVPAPDWCDHCTICR